MFNFIVLILDLFANLIGFSQSFRMIILWSEFFQTVLNLIDVHIIPHIILSRSFHFILLSSTYSFPVFIDFKLGRIISHVLIVCLIPFHYAPFRT